MNDKPEEKKSWCFNMNKFNTFLAITVSIFALIGAWYTVDCLNIKYFGDTVFAKDTEVKQLKKLRKLDRKIKEKNDRLDHLEQRKRDDLLWMSRVKDQYPDVSTMPPDLKREYDETVAQQVKLAGKIAKIKKKLERWEDELEKLELELENGSTE